MKSKMIKFKIYSIQNNYKNLIESLKDLKDTKITDYG